MSALVYPIRPTVGTEGFLSRAPVSAEDQQQLANVANTLNGWGGMLIPWTTIGASLSDSDTGTFHFYVAPKKRAVERVWYAILSGSGNANVTAGSASAVDVPLTTTPATFEFREPLAAKTSTAGGVTFTVVAAESESCEVIAVAMREESRVYLLESGTDDYGVDVVSLAARARVYDSANHSLRGLADAYKNLDARRPGIFHWSGGVGVGEIAITSAGYVDFFALYPPALGAIAGVTTTTTTFRCAVYAKVNAGSANVRFSSTQQGSNVVNAVSGTSFAWVTGDLTINAEDLTAADGRRSSGWETVRVESQKGTATTLTIAALSVVRVTQPV